MNLMIGVLGQNFEFYQGQARQLFQQQRACILRGIRSRPWNKWRCCRGKEEGPKDIHELTKMQRFLLHCLLVCVFPLLVFFRFEGVRWTLFQTFFASSTPLDRSYIWVVLRASSDDAAAELSFRSDLKHHLKELKTELKRDQQKQLEELRSQQKEIYDKLDALTGLVQSLARSKATASE